LRKALGAIFGLKLLPVSGDMVHAAKDMLDTEMEYIEYLRKRKRFFFMTQVQQTRVAVVPKGRKKGYSQSTREDRRKRRKRSRTPGGVPKTWLAIAEQKARIAGKKTGKALNKKSTAAANKISKFMRAKKPIGANKITKFVRKPAKTITTAGARGTNAATKAIGGNVATMTKAHPMTIGKNKIVPTKGLTKGVSKTAKKEAVEQLTKTAGKKALKKAGGKAATKLAGKTLIKVGLKKVPLLGAIMGTVFGIERLLKGDINGAMMEVASGVASTIPGKGTAVSLAIDAALIAKDVAEAAKQPTEEGTQPTGLKDGGQVGSPTQALIAEGGEPELVVPHSKLGPVFQSLLKQVGTVLTDVTTGFLTTLPVPSAASQAVLGEAARLQALFGTNAAPISDFKGGKISKLGGFLKKAAGAAWKSSPLGMVSGAVSAMFKGSPAAAAEQITSSTSTESSESSEETVTAGGDTSGSQISGFPITDFYGPSDWRPKPHGGVDVGTPVGTPVAFNQPGEILAAGRYGGYGNLIDVWLPQMKIQMRIAHLSKFIKKTGEFLAGEPLALTGGAKGDPGSGNSTGPHLHFEYDTKKNSTRYGGAGDPLPFGSLIQLGAVSPPSEEGKGGPSYGAPLSQTVKWPSSGGAMGGPSLMPTLTSAVHGILERVNMMPAPVVVPQLIPIPVTKVVKEKVVQHKSYGIEPFSGKYVEL